MRCSLVLLAFSLLWSLASCAATGEPFHRGEPVPGKASLYIYVVQKTLLRLDTWDVYLDGKQVTELRGGDYFYSTVSPGPHTILVKVQLFTKLSVNLSADPDTTYYFRVRMEAPGYVFRWFLERVTEPQALSELTDLTLVPGSDPR